AVFWICLLIFYFSLLKYTYHYNYRSHISLQVAKLAKSAGVQILIFSTVCYEKVKEVFGKSETVHILSGEGILNQKCLSLDELGLTSVHFLGLCGKCVALYLGAILIISLPY